MKIETGLNLDTLAVICRKENDKWWKDPSTGEKLDRNKGEMFMLIVSEITEAMEAERQSLLSEKLPGFFGVEEEIADALIRIFDYAGEYNLRIEDAFWAKMMYNATREDHKPENRMKKHGKKW